MFAVIETGGKQYRVEPGMKLKIDKLEAEVGASVTFDKVLLVAEGESLKLGRPYVEGSAVQATLIDQARERKLMVFKKRRRKMYQKRAGHRQYISVVQIQDIQG